VKGARKAEGHPEAIWSTVPIVADLPLDFTVDDERGEPWHLADHLVDSVVLLFLRGDW